MKNYNKHIAAGLVIILTLSLLLTKGTYPAIFQTNSPEEQTVSRINDDTVTSSASSDAPDPFSIKDIFPGINSGKTSDDIYSKIDPFSENGSQEESPFANGGPILGNFSGLTDNSPDPLEEVLPSHEGTGITTVKLPTIYPWDSGMEIPIHQPADNYEEVSEQDNVEPANLILTQDRSYEYYEGEEAPLEGRATNLPSYIGTSEIRQEILEDEKYLNSFGFEEEGQEDTASPADEQGKTNRVAGDSGPNETGEANDDTETVKEKEDNGGEGAAIAEAEEAATQPAPSLPGTAGTAGTVKAASVTAPPIPDTANAVVTKGLADPKSYAEAPFGYNYNNHETVNLNSGTLSYSVTDFVIPGKNGFDITVTRRYDSGSSNPQEPTVISEDGTYYYYVYCIYSQNLIEYVKNNILYQQYIRNIIKQGHGGPFRDATLRDERMELAKENLSQEYKGYEIDMVRKSEEGTIYKTGTRDNTHCNDTFGLGYGWSLGFPSIEPVEDTSSGKVETYDFLHLGDGRTYKIDLSGSSPKLVDYDLTDLVLTGKEGTYTLTYKDGRTAYFNNNKLVRMKDRFNNQIDFYYDKRSIVNIVDSAGRQLSLTKTKKAYEDILEWHFSDPDLLKDPLLLMTYRVKDNHLIEVMDQEGRSTRFAYEAKEASTRILKTEIDQSATATYHLLNKITHPTGAVSHYIYTKRSGLALSKDGATDKYVVSERMDFQNDNFTPDDAAALKVNYVKYTYAFKSAGETEDYILYIEAANVYTPNGAVQTNRFNDKGYRTEEVNKYQDFQTLKKTFIYNNKRLLKQETTERSKNGTTITYNKFWTYDNKGNILTSTDEMGNKTTMTYHSKYSLLTSKTYQKDDKTTIIEKYQLKQDDKNENENGILVEKAFLYEKKEGETELKSRTDYTYGSNHVLTGETSYYDISRDQAYTTTYQYDGRYLFRTGKTIEGAVVGGETGSVSESCTYDAFGRITASIDANGNTSSFSYDKLGRIEQEIHPDDTKKTTIYNDTDNQIMVIDENGNATVYFYTPLGQIHKVAAGSGNSGDPSTVLTIYQYDQMLRPVRELTLDENSIKAATRYRYDHFHRVTSTVVTGRDENGNLSQVLYDENILYQDVYDKETTREVRVIAGDEDAENIATTTYKDFLGRTIKQGYLWNGKEHLDTYTYDKIGNCIKVLTAKDAEAGRSHTTKWEYDFRGQVLKEYNALGHYTEQEYDSLGNLIKATDYKGNTTSYLYDALGRLLKQETPFTGEAAAITAYEYDGNGNTTMLRISSGSKRENTPPGENTTPEENTGPGEYRATAYEYDNRGRLIQVINYPEQTGPGASGIHTKYKYDDAGNQTDVYQGGSGSGGEISYQSHTRAAYDRFGNLIRATDALGQKETYRYDAYGILQEKTDRNGNKYTYSYDGLGRILQTKATNSEEETQTQTTAYTRTGQIRQTSNDTLTISYKYNSQGRVVSEKEWENDKHFASKIYQYDSNGNRTSLLVTEGAPGEDGTSLTRLHTTYEYDALGRLEEVYEEGNLIATYEYDKNGNRQSMTAGGTTTQYQYNKANLVTALSNKGKDGTIISSYTYEYQLDGNQIKKTDHTGTVTEYDYDLMGRLTAEREIPSGKDATITTHAYTFDELNNRKAMQVTGEQNYYVNYEYDPNNRLLETVQTEDNGTETVTVYTYDPNGNQLKNQTEITAPADTATPEMGLEGDISTYEERKYNLFGQLTWVLAEGKTEAEYTYRPDGLRAETTKTIMGATDSETTRFVWDGQNIAVEITDDNIVSYTRGINLLARNYKTKDDTGESKSVTESYLFNAHGDVVQLVDADTGALLTEYNYDAFGNQKEVDEEDTNPFRYCGEYLDLSSGTYYLRARNYSPATGRFLTEDTYKGDSNDPLSLNLYTYCGNNPIKYVDKNGHERIDSDWSVRYHTEDGLLATQEMTRVRFTNLDTTLFTIDGTFFHTSSYELAMGHHAYMLDPDNLMGLPELYADSHTTLTGNLEKVTQMDKNLGWRAGWEIGKASATLVVDLGAILIPAVREGSLAAKAFTVTSKANSAVNIAIDLNDQNLVGAGSGFMLEALGLSQDELLRALGDIAGTALDVNDLIKAFDMLNYKAEYIY